jgi:FxsC-like protein
MPYEFFLSYARQDDQLHHVEEFWSDLAPRVRDRLGRGGDICYFDRDSNELGSNWAENIEDALRTTKVFVALISPAYVASEYCGKELTIFRGRVAERARVDPKGAATLIIPLMWVRPIDKLPPVLDALQYDHLDLPESYREEELSVLKEIGRFKDDYASLLNHLAHQIALRIKQSPMPPAGAVEPLSTVESILHTRTGGAGPPGPNNVCFVFVAATCSDYENFRKAPVTGTPMLALRPDSTAYGASGWHWLPFQPPHNEQSAGRIAQAISGRLNLRYQEVEVNAPSFIGRIKTAASQNNVIAVVVDACTLELPRYRQWMRELDEWATANYSVVIPWNPEDTTVTRFGERLEILLRASFPARSSFNNPTYYLRIQSLDEMQDKMASILAELRLKVIDNAKAAQMVETSKMPSVDNDPLGTA